jgi:transcriptional regulator with XRE-family HTH domain
MRHYPVSMPLPHKIRRSIGAAGTTQRNVAADLDVSATAVSKWCTGDGMPSLDVFARLVRLLGVSADWLLDDGQPDSPIIYAERSITPVDLPAGVQVAPRFDPAAQTKPAARRSRKHG